ELASASGSSRTSTCPPPRFLKQPSGCARPPQRSSGVEKKNNFFLAHRDPRVSFCVPRSGPSPPDESGTPLALPRDVHSSLHCAAIAGAAARLVEVQVDLSLGLPGFYLVGMPDHACIDAKVRVLTALRNSGYQLPQKKITVNLAPGDLRKEGAAFDLAIALGVLASSGLLPLPDRAPLLAGELALSGDVLPVRGVLPIALEARRRGFE